MENVPCAKMCFGRQGFDLGQRRQKGMRLVIKRLDWNASQRPAFVIKIVDSYQSPDDLCLPYQRLRTSILAISTAKPDY